jgi:ParB/RepB/Spo0J family partition protein
MNAPVSAAALIAKPELVLIALAAIAPSDTHIQKLRREHFNKEALQELADSIRVNGMVNPPLVRPRTGAGKYELVAGERRYLAAGLAGLKEIFCSVRVLTDDQVLEIQLVENLQREDLHALEEAEGYEELMKLKKITADQVGDMIGKSRSYVYARCKLLALGPQLRRDFYAGKLDASTALELARIPQHERQAEAWKYIAEERKYGELLGVRDVRDYIREKFMLRLKAAPFDLTDEKLLPKAGSCVKCPKRTGNQADLFGDAKNSDVCTDTKCFDEKRQAHFAIGRKALEAKGTKILHGDAAKKVFPAWEQGDERTSDAYSRLDEQVYADGAHRKVSAIVGKDHEPTLVQHPATGKIIEVATKQEIVKASGAKNVTSSAGSAYNYDAAERRRKAKGPDVDDVLTERLAQLIHKKAPKTFGRAWLLDLARVVFDKLNMRDDDAIAKAFGWPASSFSSGYRSRLPAQVAKLDERGVVLFMFQMVFAICIACGCDDNHGCPAVLCKVADERACFWLHFDAEKNVGLCSECGDFRNVWKQGARVPILPLVAERYYRQVLFLCDGDKAWAIAWMHSPPRARAGDRRPAAQRGLRMTVPPAWLADHLFLLTVLPVRTHHRREAPALPAGKYVGRQPAAVTERRRRRVAAWLRQKDKKRRLKVHELAAELGISRVAVRKHVLAILASRKLMPISPENKHRYPPTGSDPRARAAAGHVSVRVLRRARWREGGPHARRYLAAHRAARRAAPAPDLAEGRRDGLVQQRQHARLRARHPHRAHHRAPRPHTRELRAGEPAGALPALPSVV